METKMMPVAARIVKHEKIQKNIMDYINHRIPKAKLVNYSGTGRDKNDGEDFGNQEMTFQSKWRESGPDIIFEANKFYPSGSGGWKRDLGRDARCKATFYVTKPKGLNKLTFQKTENVKEEILNALSSWGVPMVQKRASNGVFFKCADLTDDQITAYHNQANAKWNKSVVVHETDTVQIHFQIDRRDGYSKLLYYVKSEKMKDKGKGSEMSLRENEVLTDSTTWSK